MKRIYIMITAFLAACSLAGCTAIEEMPPLDSGSAANDVIISDADNDEISNRTTENSEDSNSTTENNEIAVELSTLKVKVKEWDKEKLNELFIEPRNDLVHKGDSENGMFGGGYDMYIGEEGEGKDAYWMVVEDGYLLSETRRDYKKYGYGTLAAYWGASSFGEYFDDAEIALFSKEDAVSRTNALLDELDIKNYTKPDVYAITANKVNDLFDREWEEKDGTPYRYEKWTADNEVYILSYSLEYGGVPLTVDYPDEYVLEEGENINENIYLGSHILAIVSKDEIISLEAFYVFSDEYEINGFVALNCTEEQAVETALKCFDGEYDAVRVLDCGIVYLPIEKQSGDKISITLVPVWKVNVSAYNEFSPLRNYDSVHIDVSTGEPLTYKNKFLQ